MLFLVSLCTLTACKTSTPPPAGAAVLGVDLVAEGLDRPLRLVSPPGDPRLFVIEQVGRIRVLDRDGGASGDSDNHAQDGSTLLGKLLRLDVSPATGYAVPPDNPFVGRPPRDEIWALGLRNPWVFSFDAATGDLWIADVGQDAWEEIDVAPAGDTGGRNYGWRLMEGPACYQPPADCGADTLVQPLHVYGHDGGRCSISGGAVYRGTAIPDLYGRYLFADYCSDQIWALTPPAAFASDADGKAAAPQVEELTDDLMPSDGFGAIADLGCDADGELYVLDNGAGRVWRIVARGPAR